MTTNEKLTYQKVVNIFKKHGLKMTRLTGGGRVRGYYTYSDSGFVVKGSGNCGAYEPVRIDWQFGELDRTITHEMSFTDIRKLSDAKLVIAKKLLEDEGYMAWYHSDRLMASTLKTSHWMYSYDEDTWTQEPCPVCGSNDTKESKINGGTPMKECLDCGHWQVID